MAVNYHIFPESNLMIVEYSGTFTIQDIVDMRAVVSKDPEYSPLLNVIEDVTNVEKVEADFDNISGVTTESIMAAGIKHCIVANTDLQFAMSRMYQMLMENSGHELRIFRDIKEAKTWVLS